MTDPAPEPSTQLLGKAEHGNGSCGANGRQVPSVAQYLAAILRNAPPLTVEQIDTLRQIFAPPQP
jgi:hypothetical protein